ncbi:MAG: hypothetical protein SFU25_12030, partial [Candidatus Caenarcaniphilales bacterium]|nr:hypothetical protein [Candidatus Caenarcaniphilales bacterium]
MNIKIPPTKVFKFLPPANQNQALISLLGDTPLSSAAVQQQILSQLAQGQLPTSDTSNSLQNTNLQNSLLNNNYLSQILNNAGLTSLSGFLISTLGVLGINLGSKQYQNLSTNSTDTKKIAEVLLDSKPLSKDEIAQLYARAYDFILHPEKITLPKSLDSMYTTGKAEALVEFRKFVVGFSKILLSGHIPMFTFDWDGTKASKTAFFVSFTGSTNSDEDRGNVQSEMLYMHKLKGLAQVYNEHVKKPNEREIKPEELALYHILSMRAVAWDGQSYYRVQATPQMNGENPAFYSNGSIDGICAELGLDPKLAFESLKDPSKVSIFETISIAGFGGPLRVRNGREIEFVAANGEKGKNGAAYFAYVGEVYNRADKDKSSDGEAHRDELQKITSINEFRKAYEEYLPGGSKAHVKMGGYFEELAFVTKKLGIGILERKGVPKYLLDSEWYDFGKQPTWLNDLELATCLEEAKKIDLAGGDWKEFLRDKFVPIQAGDHHLDGKVELPKSLLEVFYKASSFKEFKDEARQASWFMITSHAIDGDSRFVDVTAEEYDYYKEVLLKGIVRKYLAEEGDKVKPLSYDEMPPICRDVANTADLLEFEVNIANNGDKAPYLEISPKVNKAAAFKEEVEEKPFVIQIGAGDSQGTDAGMLVGAINDGYIKGKKGANQFADNIIPFLKSKGIETNESEINGIAKAMEEDGIGLSVKVRGQIDLGNDTALNHYITQSINLNGSPFELKVELSPDKKSIQSLEVVGKEFGTTEKLDPSCLNLKKGKYTLAKGNNRLRQLLTEKAVPFYEERIVSATDVHQNNSMTSSVLHLLFGNDPDKIDHSTLVKEISGGEDPQHLRWGS